MNPAAAILRFHLRSAVRLAIRAGLPVAALITVGVGLSSDADAVLREAARRLGEGSIAAVMVLVAIGLGLAFWAAPRISHGQHGWLRHLPASLEDHGRGLWLALLATQIPVAVLWIVLWTVARTSATAELRSLFAMPVILAAVALIARPAARRFVATGAGAIALVLAIRGGWVGMILGAALLLVGSGRYEPPALAASWIARGSRSAAMLPFQISARAVGRRIVGAWFGPLICFAAGALVYNNNPESDVTPALRGVGTFAVTFLVAALAERLAAHRPPWRWMRSLPWSSFDRIRYDGAWFAGHALAIPILFGLILDPWAGVATLAAVPLLALRATAALFRRSSPVGVQGRIVGEGVFIGFAMMLSGWVVAMVLLLYWPAWLDAARLERDLDVSRWSPQEHLAAGDPMDWRGG